MGAFNTITVTRNGQIATLTIQSKDRKALTGPHIEIGAAISELRYDNGVRVVVLTGTDDAFFLPPKGSPKASGHTPATTGTSRRACTAPTSRLSRLRSR